MVSFLTCTEMKSNKARMTDDFQQPCLTPSFLPTPRSGVHLEKLTGSQLVKKYPEFCGTQRFITPFTIARHLSLSWASYSLKRWKFCTLINRKFRYLHLHLDLLNDLQTNSYAAVHVTWEKISRCALNVLLKERKWYVQHNYLLLCVVESDWLHVTCYLYF